MKALPKKPVSKETIARVKDFLLTHRSGVLSTITPELLPHGVVIYFAVNDDLTVSFVTKKSTAKSENLRKHDTCVLVVYEESTQTTVQVAGHCVDITNSPEASGVFQRTLEASAASESGIPPVSKLNAGHYVAYKIVPKTIRMAVFTRPDNGAEKIYETLNF